MPAEQRCPLQPEKPVSSDGHDTALHGSSTACHKQRCEPEILTAANLSTMRCIAGQRRVIPEVKAQTSSASEVKFGGIRVNSRRSQQHDPAGPQIVQCPDTAKSFHTMNELDTIDF